MATVDQDYVIRMIAELGAFLRRVRDLIRLGRVDAALEEIQAGAQSLVGMDVRLFALLDAPTLVTQLGSAEKACLVAALLAVQAEAYESLDEPEQAHSSRMRALELYLELQLAGTPPDPRGRLEACELLTRAGGVDAVAERYRGAARLLGG